MGLELDRWDGMGCCPKGKIEFNKSVSSTYFHLMNKKDNENESHITMFKLTNFFICQLRTIKTHSLDVVVTNIERLKIRIFLIIL